MTKSEIKKAREIIDVADTRIIDFTKAAREGWPKALDEIERLEKQLSDGQKLATAWDLDLSQENKKLRAALEKLRDGPGNKMANWKLTWAHEFAAKALK